MNSIEDHGYILNLGIPDVNGFLSFKDAKKLSPANDQVLPIGRLIDTCISKVSGNGTTVTVTVDPDLIASASVSGRTQFNYPLAHVSQLSEITNITSLIPGTLVQSLVTAVVSSGLNLQILGYFAGTVDQFHLPRGDVESNFKVGQKIKARVLYDVTGSTPPRFSLSLAEHVVSLTWKATGSEVDGKIPMQESYPIGTILDAVKVIQVESERGLVVEVFPGVEGFVHVGSQSLSLRGTIHSNDIVDLPNLR